MNESWNHLEVQEVDHTGPAEPERHRVYFVQGVDGGPIKVGVALDPVKRLRGLQTGSPVELTILKVVEGGYGLEREIHKRLEDSRSFGEWFHPEDPELLRMLHKPGYVEALCPEPFHLVQVQRPVDPDHHMRWFGVCSVCGVDLEDAYGRHVAKLDPAPTMCAACIEARGSQ